VNRQFPARDLYAVPLPRGGVLRLGDRPLVMGVLNITPDSFASERHLVKGGVVDAAQAADLALQLEADGADLIDIGGESTRPGSGAVSADQEAARVLPVITALAGQVSVPISVDTTKAVVAEAAIRAGATIVNDVSGLQNNADLARVVADSRAGLVLMHMRGRPETMYAEATYEDVVTEVVAELARSVEKALAAGVSRDQIIVDPGIGFAKHAAHSYGVLARLAEVASGLGRPILVGPSRKSFLSSAVGGRPPAERDWGTAAAVTAAVLAGAHIVRVHAVAEMVQVVRVAEEIRKAGDEGRVVAGQAGERQHRQ
jgi:dihydropteroate synthase